MEDCACDLSVVMPVYNTGQPIKKSVLSLVENLRDFNYEIVIVNDGSTDNSAKILHRLAREYPFIRIHEQANAGAGAAKKTGLGLARGRYVWVRDINDIVPGGAFAGFDQSLLRQGLDLLIFDYELCDERGKSLGMLKLDHDVYSSLPSGIFDPSSRPELLYSSHFTWNKFYCRAFLAEHGIANSSLRAHDDIIFHTQSLCLARSARRETRAILREVSHAGQMGARPELRLLALPAFAEAESFLALLAPDLAQRTAWRVFKANHLYWIYNNCGEERARIGEYYESFLRGIPKAEFLDFIKAAWLRPEAMRYALALRGLNIALAEKLFRAPTQKTGGLGGLLARFWPCAGKTL